MWMCSSALGMPRNSAGRRSAGMGGRGRAWQSRSCGLPAYGMPAPGQLPDRGDDPLEQQAGRQRSSVHRPAGASGQDGNHPGAPGHVEGTSVADVGQHHLHRHDALASREAPASANVASSKAKVSFSCCGRGAFKVRALATAQTQGPAAQARLPACGCWPASVRWACSSWQYHRAECGA